MKPVQYHPPQPRIIRVTIEGSQGVGKSTLEQLLLDAMLWNGGADIKTTVSTIYGEETRWYAWGGVLVEVTTTQRVVA